MRSSGALALAGSVCFAAIGAPAMAEPLRLAAIERVSVDSAGNQGNDGSGDPAISADGRFVAFQSSADNLVPGLQRHPGPPPGTGSADIFVHDRKTGLTELASVDSDGSQGNQNSLFPTISADGRFVAFASFADDLVPGDTNGIEFLAGFDVFVHDRKTGVTERVSVDSAGNQGNNGGCCFPPAISADGRFVAFVSYADNLVLSDTNGQPDVFVHDRKTGVTERVSVDSAGNQGNGASSFSILAANNAISANGRFVTFESSADNLVLSDTNGQPDVFVHDRMTGVTERVSVDSTGAQVVGGSDPAISADGRFVAFVSYADNLVPGDTNGKSDVFIHDRMTGVTERVSIDSVGNRGNGGYYPAISATGRFIAFLSSSRPRIPGGDIGQSDVFVYDRKTGTTEWVSVDSAGNQSNGTNLSVAISATGRFVAFGSLADNLVPGDTNGVLNVFAGADVFIRDLAGE